MASGRTRNQKNKSLERSPLNTLEEKATNTTNIQAHAAHLEEVKILVPHLRTKELGASDRIFPRLCSLRSFWCDGWNSDHKLISQQTDF